MATSSQDDEEIVGINVTPFVDVMLVLLVIFMVTANYIAHQSITVQLPAASTGEAVPTKNLSFVIDKDSQLFFNGTKISFEEITSRIQSERQADPKKNLQALIAADRATPHGTVVKLIDSVRKNGITELAINVEQGQ